MALEVQKRVRQAGQVPLTLVDPQFRDFAPRSLHQGARARRPLGQGSMPGLWAVEDRYYDSPCVHAHGAPHTQSRRFRTTRPHGLQNTPLWLGPPHATRSPPPPASCGLRAVRATLATDARRGRHAGPSSSCCRPRRGRPRRAAAAPRRRRRRGARGGRAGRSGGRRRVRRYSAMIVEGLRARGRPPRRPSSGGLTARAARAAKHTRR